MQGLKVKIFHSLWLILLGTFLWAAVAAGNIEERGDLEVELQGRVFLYHPDCDLAISSHVADPLDEMVSRLDRNPLTRISTPGREISTLWRSTENRNDQRAGSERIKVLGRALDEGGAAIDVLANGTYGYVGTTGSLNVFDVSNPLAPVSVNEIVEPAPCLDKEASLMAAVMGRNGDMVLLDISDPLNPTEISRLAAPEGFHFDNLSISGSFVVAVAGGTLQKFGWSALMQVIDVTDPYSPVVRSNLIGINDGFRGILVEQNLVFLTIYDEGLAIFDISNPENIVQIGFLSISGAADDLVYLDGYLYLSGNGMVIVDASDPAHPVLVSQWGNAYTGGIVVSGGYAYITDDDDMSLHIVDVTDPFNPQGVGQVPAYGRVYYIDIAGSTVYLPDRIYGLLLIDVSDPQVPVLLSMTPTGFYTQAVDVEGVSASANVNFASLATLDVTDPFDPEVQGSFTPVPDSTGGNTPLHFGIDLAGDIAISSNYNRGIRIHDVSDPTDPGLSSSLNLGTGSIYNPVARLGNLAYVGTTEIVIFDITDPTNPVQVGTGPAFSSSVTDLVITENTGFASSLDELAIFDLSDPLNPVEMSRFSATESIISIAVDGDILGLYELAYEGWDYLASLDLYDVSDLLSPVLITSVKDLSMTGFGRPDVSLAAEGGRFYLCGGDQLMVVDATDPANAFLAAIYPEPLGSWWVGWDTFGGVTVSDGLIYLAGYRGVEILRFLDIGVFLDPDTIPVVVPQGGDFSYDVTLENFTETQQTFDAWIDVALPGGGILGPLVGPVTLTLNAGQQVTTTLNQQVPFAAPPDSYFLYAHVGTYPGEELDNDRFTVEVVE